MVRTVCALFENADGEAQVELRAFGGFKRDRRAMAEWVASFEPEVVVMESTGIYWKSPYAALEQVGIVALVVNAHHVKQVPGRKTNIADAQWLAILARSGLLKGGFVPPQHMRELRLVSRQMHKLTEILAGEKNRLHKVLTDGGIRLSAVVSDMEAFGSSEKLAAWAGVCPGNNESAGKRKAGRTRKGNPYVRRVSAQSCNVPFCTWRGP